MNGIIREGGLTQVVEEPTRESNTLDVFLLKPLDSLIRTSTIPGISDHNAVELVLKWNVPKRSSVSKNVELFQYRNADNIGFQE